ncbi:hypothetical protein PENSPDRAFT_663462 [Peniophora sp. CONT]|nr:hypothetical protein PENSPDRAFT_663462 [Peniophora sp. CONT]
MAKHSRRRSSSLPRADLSRLMDPSYLPNSYSSTSSSPDSVHAYIDDDGEMHDPDYRDFPILAAPATRRPAWETGFERDEDEAALLAQTKSRPMSARERRRARYDAEYAHYKPTTYTSHATVPEPRKRKLRTLSPRRSSFVTEPEPELAPEYDEHPWAFALDQPEPVTRSTDDSPYVPSDSHTEWTPTCGQQIRRKWQSVSLSLRFAVFRTQRRIKRKLGT